MNLKKIRELVKIGKENGVDEIEYKTLFSRIRIVFKHAPIPLEQYEYVTRAPLHPLKTSDNAAQEAKSENKTQTSSGKKYHEIRSPIVGTFYRAPSPGAPPFVEKGDRVKKGQVLCIVEAMKVMNEIESDVDGTVVDILVENAEPVEFNQVLFLIDTSS